MLSNKNRVTTQPLEFPIYGRNIQNMVDICVTIKDPEERQKCAETIVQKMKYFSPMDKDREDYQQVLWDHLLIMSHFKLEVDYPYPVINEAEYSKKSTGYLDNDHQHRPRYRHYGRAVERMIRIAIDLPEGEERIELTKKIAIQMKKDYLNWNHKSVGDAKIYTDLYELSEGKLYLDELMFVLPETATLLDMGTNNPKNRRNNTGKVRRTKK